MQLSNVFVSLALTIASVSAVPVLNKRIAQTIIDSVQNWENACDAANGGAQCNAIAVNASSTLLAAADACAQQDSGDIMVNLAKSLNSQAMITAAQIFVQQPRNSPNSLAVVYCQHAPANSELNGLFQCQFQGDNENQFTNGQAPGGAGTIPFGLSAPVNPPGSCPAHTSGPIPDGVQLSSLVSSPGTPAASSSSSSGSGASTSSSSPDSSSSSPDSSSSSAPGDTSFPPPQQGGSSSSSPAASTPAASTPSSGSSSGFQFSNGQQAQQQNAGFAQLTSSSSCTAGSQACVNGQFAQCVGSQFTLTACGTGTQCFALPLVNKAGTSITCTTQADASARIAATGATGGITGSGSGAASAPASDSGASSSGSGSGSGSTSTSTSTSGSSNNAAAPATSPAAASSGSTGFQFSNGQEAQKLNAEFATLTASSSCTDGQQACINGGFAQCVGGQFSITQCAGGTQCFALPLVNKPGTSVTCDTESDAAARIANTGVTGGITGSS